MRGGDRHDRTLIGHSDADAGLHALTDALPGGHRRRRHRRPLPAHRPAVEEARRPTASCAIAVELVRRQAAAACSMSTSPWSASGPRSSRTGRRCARALAELLELPARPGPREGHHHRGDGLHRPRGRPGGPGDGHGGDARMTAEEVLAAARERGLMIVTAESCTGGLIAAALTEVPGSSDVVWGGFRHLRQRGQGRLRRRAAIHRRSRGGVGRGRRPHGRAGPGLARADVSVKPSPGRPAPAAAPKRSRSGWCISAASRREGSEIVVHVERYGDLGRGVVSPHRRDGAGAAL